MTRVLYQYQQRLQERFKVCPPRALFYGHASFSQPLPDRSCEQAPFGSTLPSPAGPSCFSDQAPISAHQVSACPPAPRKCPHRTALPKPALQQCIAQHRAQQKQYVPPALFVTQSACVFSAYTHVWAHRCLLNLSPLAQETKQRVSAVGSEQCRRSWCRARSRNGRRVLLPTCEARNT